MAEQRRPSVLVRKTIYSFSCVFVRSVHSLYADMKRYVPYINNWFLFFWFHLRIRVFLKETDRQTLLGEGKLKEIFIIFLIPFYLQAVLTKLNSMVWVRERATPTERPPLVGEVIANFWGLMVPRGQCDGFLLGFLDKSLYFSIK
jgi:hypothetical protein